MYDVIIVGGGPAGLSAAEVLGRCRRRVLVCDLGQPRNAASRAMHGYLGRDGIAPAEFLEIARQEVARYGIELKHTKVASATRCPEGFNVFLPGGQTLKSRKLLIATGLRDRLPPIPGIEAFYGLGVFHCPYCDGWEVRDQPLVAYGIGKNAYGLAFSLKTWSGTVTLCTGGPSGLRPLERAGLARAGIAVREEEIERLEGAGALERITFRMGDPLACRGLFFSTGQYQRSGLAQALGCKFTGKGTVRTGRLSGTNIPGLYVAGDASHDVQFVVVAAAEGAKAAVAINKALQEEERELATSEGR